MKSACVGVLSIIAPTCFDSTSHIIFREHVLFLAKVMCYNYEYFIIRSDVAAYRVLFPVQGVMWTHIHEV
jgi:hypothetical protein